MEYTDLSILQTNFKNPQKLSEQELQVLTKICAHNSEMMAVFLYITGTFSYKLLVF